MKFADWDNFSAWLESLGMFHMDLGLGRMRKALALLGLEKLPFKTLHVLGTNGKGSTCAFLDSIARENGIKTGLYTSPHFISPRERILVDGHTPAKKIWLQAANAIFSAHGGDPGLTYFEFLTVMAILIFRDLGVRLAILEAGLGGLNDATTAIKSDICIFTPIALDHTQILGSTLESIAADKAAAIEEKSAVFSAPQLLGARRILKAVARAKNSPVEFVPPLPFSCSQFLGLEGQNQLANAGLALRAMEFAAPLSGGNRLDCAATARGLARVFIPGRLQIIPERGDMPCFILDGAHNPHATKCLIREFSRKGRHLPRPAAIIYSCLADKDWRTSLTLLLRQFGNIPFLIPQLKNRRAMDAGALVDFSNKRRPGRAEARTGANALADAISAAANIALPRKQAVLVTGSLYLLASFYALYPQFLKPDAACGF